MQIPCSSLTWRPDPESNSTDCLSWLQWGNKAFVLIHHSLSFLNTYIRNQIYFTLSMKSPAFKSTAPTLPQNKTCSLTTVMKKKLGWASECREWSSIKTVSSPTHHSSSFSISWRGELVFVDRGTESHLGLCLCIYWFLQISLIMLYIYIYSHVRKVPFNLVVSTHFYVFQQFITGQLYLSTILLLAECRFTF